MRHKSNIMLLTAGALATTFGVAARLRVEVANPLPLAREAEMVEIDTRLLRGYDGAPLRVVGADGREVPSQLTSDGLLIFQTTLPPRGKASYTLERGETAPQLPRCYGRVFPEHKDNMNWENDRGAYVASGPALQNAGQLVYGYDIWTKSVDTLVLEQRNRDNARKISIHKDHGTGMDAYIVANTLGAGTAALVDADGSLIFPWAWREAEVLDNGPLRFRTRLTYSPITVGADSCVIETRDITLDAGTDLNRTVISYSALPHRMALAPGIVVHTQNPGGYASDAAKGIIAYADSTDNAANGNGVIHIGAILPQGADSVAYKPVDTPARDALGHILAYTAIAPGESLTYYWGASWSKSPWGPASPEEWLDRLRGYADRINAPLKVKIKGKL